MERKPFSGFLHGADYNYEQWLEYPDVLESDFTFMKKAKCNAMTVGIFAWTQLEPAEGRFNFGWLDTLLDSLAENGIRAILATPSGSKPAWLSAAYPEVCRVDRNGRREAHGGRHNHCRTSPVYRQKCVEINTQLARRYRDHPALYMWHVSNEYNAGYCYCDFCINAFRSWLKARYITLEALNRAWWTSFWSHTFTDWSQIYPGDPSIHGLMLDWQRFTSDQTLDFFLYESEPLRRISPDIPITTNFMTPDVGLDYRAFAPYVSIISWDNYPQWHVHEKEWEEGVKTSFYHDLFRSMKNEPFMMMESSPTVTNWQGISIPKKKNMHLLSSLQAVAHGSDTVQYFQWRQSRGGEEKFHGAVISHSGHPHTRVFQDVSAVGEALEDIREVSGSGTAPEVAIIYDFQSEWALNNAQLPRNIDKSYQERCIIHYKAFWQAAIPVDIKDCSNTDFSQYKVVIAPMLYMLRDNIEKKIEDFVSSGGIFITTYLSGLVDTSDLCFLGGTPGPLRNLLGFWVEDTDILSDHQVQEFSFLPAYGSEKGKVFRCIHYVDRLHIESAEVLAGFTRDDMKGYPAVTKRQFGRGSAYYIASRNTDEFYDCFYRRIIDDHDVTRRYPHPLPRGVTIQYRQNTRDEYVFIMNFNAQEVEITNPHSGSPELIGRQPTGDILTIPSYGIKILKHTIMT